MTLAETLHEMIAESAKRTAHLPRPIASVTVHREGMALDVCLDGDKPDYGEWIKGEGADISLKREVSSGKVCGARLPLLAKTLIIGGDFGTITIDIEAGTMTVEPSCES